jgi:bacteriocin-like protein
MEKEVAVKVALSDEELNTISGGSVVTKQIVLDGKATLVSIGINASVAGKNKEGGNQNILGGSPGTIL